jgi:hypothetical protein
MNGNSPTTATGGALNVNLDMDQLHTVLSTQPRFTITSTTSGQQTTLIEAIRTVRPGTTLADNQVNVLC